MSTCIHRIGGQGQHSQKAKGILCSLTRQRALFLLFGAIVESINLQVEYRNLQSNSRFPDRKSTRLNSSHVAISYAVFCLKKKNTLSLAINLRMHVALLSLMQKKITLPSIAAINLTLGVGSDTTGMINERIDEVLSCGDTT